MAKPKTSSADLLLQLLERVPDADALERLLEAQNLLAALKHAGRSEDDVRAALKRGARPGDLLLEVLDEGHTAEELLAALPPAGPRRGDAKEPRRRRPRREKITFESLGLTTLNKVGGIVALVGIVLPGMIVGGFFPLWYGGDPTPWYGVALALGAVGGVLFARGRTPTWIGTVGGAASALGGVLLIGVLSEGRASVLKLEIALWVLLGALPGLLLYWLLGRAAKRRA